MLLIYLPEITARCRYIFDLVFKEEFGIEYETVTDLELFELYEKEKINYSFKRNAEEFYIHASPLLFEQGIRNTEVLPREKMGTTVLFESDISCNIGFDIFAAVFYMVSRYEEHLPFVPDKFGRYRAADSLAYRNKFLQQPVVNIWIDILRNKLKEKFRYLSLKSASFNYILTYDIDIAYAFKGRNISRFLGATVSDVLRLNFENVFTRLRSILSGQKDPWDVYDVLEEMIDKNSIPAIFFFLLADYGKHDKNISYRHPLMKNLITRLAASGYIGLHPSFMTGTVPQKILIEKKRLESLSGKEINKSRQHYLKFTLPDTYRYLINAGITEDYSMGFAGTPGFRAGTCRPFYFYDLTHEKSTALKVFPVSVMEGSFINYLGLRPQVALEYIYNLVEAVKSVNGTFISIWHNHTLSETGSYKGWKFVHDKMVERVLHLQNQIKAQ